MPLMTKQILEEIKTDAGGFTGASLRALGLTQADLKPGWQNRLCTLMFTDQQIAAAKAGRSVYSKTHLKRLDKGAEVPLTDAQYWYLIKQGFPKERVEKLSASAAYKIIHRLKAGQEQHPRRS